MSKEKGIVFVTHLGVGDQIICNGIVVNLLKDYDEVILPITSRTLCSIERMYKGLNVRCIDGNTDDDVTSIIRKLQSEGYSFLKIGAWGDHFMVDDMPFSESFYDQAGIPFSESFDSFHLIRNEEEEESLYNRYQPSGKYAFLHQDSPRGLNVSFDKHAPTEGLAVVEPDFNLEKPSSDYCKLIEGAEEVHCIDSSFALLIDRLPETPNQKLFLHRYVRWDSSKGNQQGAPTTYRKPWEVIL